MRTGANRRFLLLILSLMATPAIPAARQPLREPLPLEVAVSLSHNGRSPVDLSPDGEWLAHTYGRDETVPRHTSLFAATGFPFAEGNARMQAALTHTKTGQVIRLGGSKGASWGAVWSPDGQRVAFYADDTGEAGLWIWNKATGQIDRFPGIIVRPLFGFELVREMGADGSATAAGYYERGQGNMGGTPWQYPERYRENSPLFTFDRVQTPLLIGQGEKDGRLIASDAVFVAFQRLGKSVEYRIYENEGHVITAKPNVLDFWRRRLDFLDAHLDLARDAQGQLILENGRAASRRPRS